MDHLSAGDKADDTLFVGMQLFKGINRIINILSGGGNPQGETHRAVGLIVAEAQGQEGVGWIHVA